MLTKLRSFVRQYDLIHPGDTVICAVSGGADSVALLFSLYLLKEKMGITLKAAHFNHKLRGEESDADEEFVRRLCHQFDIELYVDSGEITPGKKGLEAAARDARYAFFRTLPGKIATAHTADDNAETVLMRLIRGTGLKGLGAISPVRGNLIRPMLTVTRQDVLAFLEEYHLPHREDSSNQGDDFLRNRIRHHLMPLLARENPQIGQNLSAMALRLRQDEEELSNLAMVEYPVDVEALREMPPARRSRVLERFLKDCGVKEPEAEHIAKAEALVFSQRPSARADFPGGVTLCRNYGVLQVQPPEGELDCISVACPGVTELPGYTLICEKAAITVNEKNAFTVAVEGNVILRSRQPGDAIRLSGGTKSLKKLFIDRKVPVHLREMIPVLADERGLLGVCGVGADQDRLSPEWEFRFIKKES